MHTIIVGQTLSGKTTLAKQLAQHYQRHGIAAVVLDPNHDPGWALERASAPCRMFDDPAAFMAYVKNPDQCLQCALFIDESGDMLDKYDTDNNWVTTRSRHHGHVVHLITQRAQQVSATMRSQCSVLYCFNINPSDAKIYAIDFNCPEVASEAPLLPQGHFLKVGRFKPLVRGRLW